MDADAVELRVLGCLLEKQRTTPDQYPLTLNALRLACNQTTNRDPIVEYDERAGGFASAFGHFTAPEAIGREMRDAGYERIASYDLLDRQSFQIFRADDGTGE